MGLLILRITMADCYDVDYLLFAGDVLTSASRQFMRIVGLCVFLVDLLMESPIDWMGPRSLAFLVYRRLSLCRKEPRSGKRVFRE